MALETATYIDGLNASNPAASDAISTADDHLRLIKSTIKATFPNITGPMTLSQSQIAPLASPALTGTPTAPTASAGTNTTQIATTAYVQGEAAALLNAVYPVGSIYTNASNSTNPASLLGFGTWAAFGAGRVMVGFNAADPLFDTAEETGGSKDAIVVAHTHTFSATTNVEPAHNHTYSWGSGVGSRNAPDVDNDGTNNADVTGPTSAAGEHSHTVSGTTASTGSSGTNANIQPYIAVYMWKRTA